MRTPISTLTALSLALALGACAGTTSPRPEALHLQAELLRVEGDTRIVPYAGTELVDARRAVDALLIDGRRMPERDFHEGVYLADRLIKIAEAEGLAGHAEAVQKQLGTERETLLIEVRSHEAELAVASADAARREAEIARTQAQIARADAEAMRQRLAALEARQTDRGLVVTLGDVLFETGRAELKPGAMRSLDELVQVLRENPGATVAVEGHTDSVGGRDYNYGLSQRRADAVRGFLLSQGIAPSRITARGLGPDYPVASNGDAAGRQQNRRVELVIQDRPVTVQN